MQEQNMGFWAKFFGTTASKKSPPAPGTAKTADDLMAQRQALANRLLTPERQERLAQAMQVQAAKQRLNRNLASDQGQQHLTSALRDLLKKD
ncbi:hypothetical protein ACFPL7_17690 [Dongia soli]|uniref:Uncharacterized protein n=1 Tax=Dongia soli TaxID=600628 RepID=A0ABU5E532_9PROT|nr:hypothetical protein [Dongia soli]MDY0881425.1 hypothetical protein [Dongia soli]